MPVHTNIHLLPRRRFLPGLPRRIPDYLTQTEIPDELQENLKDPYAHLTSSQIPVVRRAAELRVA